MKFLGDYHTHTRASDGHTTLAQNVCEAKRKGLKEIVVSDHGFQTVLEGMTAKNFEKQAKFCATQKDVRVLHGIESNILSPDGTIDTPDEYIGRLDVLNVGFHRFLKPKYMFSKFVFKNGFCSKAVKRKLIEVNTQAYIIALEKYPIDTLVHLNHMAPVNARPIFEKARETGTYIELNAKHLDDFLPLVKDAIESGVNFIVGSDAHRQKDIGGFAEVAKFIERNGIPIERVFGTEGNLPTFKDKTNRRKENERNV